MDNNDIIVISNLLINNVLDHKDNIRAMIIQHLSKNKELLREYKNWFRLK